MIIVMIIMIIVKIQSLELTLYRLLRISLLTKIIVRCRKPPAITRVLLILRLPDFILLGLFLSKAVDILRLHNKVRLPPVTRLLLIVMLLKAFRIKK